MQLHNTSESYGWVAIGLHWAIAAGVVAMFAIGLTAAGAPREARGAIMGWHISVGFFVLLLVLVRTYWSLTQPKPIPPPQGQLLNSLAFMVHWTLLAGVLLLVFSGPLAVLSGGRDISVFGVLTIPTPFAERNDGVHEAAEVAHAIGRAVVFFGLLIHVIASLKHLVIDRDGVFSRMLRPGPLKTRA